jgi:H+/Cl- antiporter ClcA
MTQSKQASVTPSIAPFQELRDFTTTWRVLPITVLAVIIGVVAAYVAVVLLKLINFFTNVFFYQHLSTASAHPSDAHIGAWIIVVPVIGGLLVGLMARFGSDKIRGHGIPEAIEAILQRGAKVEPKIAVLKPVSAAIAIGSGGPFGAEGPIIMTGGAFGSLIAQFFHLTSAERKTLLVAGAAAGMSATFAAPFAAIVLAVELLLFEWKPRSLIPVALASITAEAARIHLLGPGPVFPVPLHDVALSPLVLVGCLIAGLLSGGLAAGVTQLMYSVEDGFASLKHIHWMWWPAIGSVAVGIGGMIFPRALGVGYDVIQQLLQGDAPLRLILGVLIVKSLIWSISLGSGTSGGVLAPLLMMGAALGAVDAYFLPHQGLGFWPLISMGAMLAGTMRAPLTGVIFSFELTGDYHSILPLLIACVVAHTLTVLTMPRSILTEKISRHGHHLSCEYAVDPLEALSVEDVMRKNVTVFPAEATLAELEQALDGNDSPRGQFIYPVIDANKRVLGVVTRHDVAEAVRELGHREATNVKLSEKLNNEPMVAYPEEPLRMVVNRMAATGLTRFPVVKHGTDNELVGLVGLQDLLKARELSVAEESDREQVLRLRFPLSLRWRGRARNGDGSDSDKDA